MIDIIFYKQVYNLKQKLIKQGLGEPDSVWESIEQCRRQEPVIYNIETTNACNMRCEMCPRTTMMTRPIELMDMKTFENICNQIRPFSTRELIEWDCFVNEEYGIPDDDMSENHFFLHIVAKVIVLHGYGDPLLDRHMPERVKVLSQKGIPTYFSCNPANIDIEKVALMFSNGLSYIKFSIESIDDGTHKNIRGNASDFSNSYNKICKLIEIKEKYNYKTTLVITMLNLIKHKNECEFDRLKEAFRNKDVYIYLKSQDQQWYQNNNYETKSIHWQEFCQFPWSSMTIKSNGEAVMCVEDFNNEIILGDAKKQSLEDIWNGEKYSKLRKQHFNLEKSIKCTQQCDMKLIGHYLNSTKTC